jgi:hypothetical protein
MAVHQPATLASADTAPCAVGSDYSPWRQSFPDSCEGELDLDPLRLRLDIHDELILRHVYGPGGLVTTTAIAGTDFRQAVAADARFATGLLPPNALWAGVTPSGRRTMLFVPHRVWKVKLKEKFGGPVEQFAVPMPDLVFMVLQGGQPPYVWAVKGRPASEDATFFRMPAYNVFETGRICVGSHAFPDDPARVPAEFFDSYFSPDGQYHDRSVRHPRSIRDLWRELDGRKDYPLDDLVPQFTFADATHAGTRQAGW